ncbi:HAD hydrolase-like protein [Chelativorans salis]|uniref:HAD hydrolase-like protein n=1 Tax=Chelativorans salis TaxID=2978478 RepID=A0ABT2LN01_9HYPH|nr:HAD hydrolase-like protein [Chelativorans sp. EGI FJ00035]MCT7375691.1 HAD hydrolase-like protein [Chelativorans sp. EGI FJ00035]
MESQEKRPAILFDLDGTLTDPFFGITNGIRHVLQKMGRTAPAAEDLRVCIGPPIQDTFARLLESSDEALIWEAVGHYRQRYGEIGKFENKVIPGIPEALAHCEDAGFFLSVATSKVETYTGDILDHFGLSRFFDAVHGSALDGTNSNKADLIRHILASEPVDPARTVMVGDRSHDIIGAKANALPAIGVLWGFGARAELAEAGAAEIVARPEKLPRAIAETLTPLPA